MTYVRIWKFRPQQARLQEFAAAYAGDGSWSDLFSEAPGYRGTVLLTPTEAGGEWLTIDRWESAAHFETFQRDFGERYRALDAELEGLADHEEFIGAFDEAG